MPSGTFTNTLTINHLYNLVYYMFIEQLTAVPKAMGDAK